MINAINGLGTGDLLDFGLLLVQDGIANGFQGHMRIWPDGTTSVSRDVDAF